MTTFLIAPYSPEMRDAMIIKGLRTPSNLWINPEDYKALLIQRWPDIRFIPAKPMLLAWIFPTAERGAGLIGGLEDHQTVIVDTPFKEFLLWHRSVIPGLYPLFLFHEGSWSTLELKPDTTLEEIQRCIGKGF